MSTNTHLTEAELKALWGHASQRSYLIATEAVLAARQAAWEAEALARLDASREAMAEASVRAVWGVGYAPDSDDLLAADAALAVARDAVRGELS